MRGTAIVGVIDGTLAWASSHLLGLAGSKRPAGNRRGEGLNRGQPDYRIAGAGSAIEPGATTRLMTSNAANVCLPLIE